MCVLQSCSMQSNLQNRFSGRNEKGFCRDISISVDDTVLSATERHFRHDLDQIATLL